MSDEVTRFTKMYVMNFMTGIVIIIISSFTRTLLPYISVSNNSIYPMVYIYIYIFYDIKSHQTMRIPFMEANEVKSLTRQTKLDTTCHIDNFRFAFELRRNNEAVCSSFLRRPPNNSPPFFSRFLIQPSFRCSV